MKFSECIAGLSALWLLGGCSSARGDGPETAPTEARLVHGSVTLTFAVTNSKECTPFGFPMTAFLTDAFGPDDLVADVATPTSATECLHEQRVGAGADAWATLAYQGICLGGGDSRLCGAQATRLCSIETMSHWAEQPSGGFTAVDPIFHFNYVVQEASDASRGALHDRVLEEAETMLTESESVLRQHTAGTRNCPGEDYDEIAATYAKGLNPYDSPATSNGSPR